MLRLSLDVRDPRIRRAVRRTVIAAAGPTLPIEDVSPGGEADLLIVDGAAAVREGAKRAFVLFDELDDGAVAKLIEHPAAPGLLAQSTRIALEHGELFAAVRKALSGDAFGIEKYLPALNLTELSIRDSAEKPSVLACLDAFMEEG